MMGWKADKRWSDQYLPEIKRICGEYLIGEAPVEEDQGHNTDLVVLKIEAVRIACRVRREEYLSDYGQEFTIRLTRAGGMKTELAKIMEGWGDYFFYGFGGNDAALMAWRLAKLGVFRLWYNRELYVGNRPGLRRQNKDGSSELIAFRWTELPDDFVLAHHTERMEVMELERE